jgi:hypothetical protein
MNKIIQFLHPGAEHDSSSGMVLNSNNHRRKFMRLNGACVDSNNEIHQEALYFWGEWEAQSELLKSNLNTSKNFPSHLFYPFYHLGDIGKCNTDPFVFGTQFYYCICKQGHFKSMRLLNKGDLILFGSHKEQEFVLDTLFVVKNHTTYSKSTFNGLKEPTNETYFDVSIAPIFKKESVECIPLIEDNDGCVTPKDKNLDEGNKCLYSKTKGVDEYKNYEAAMYHDKDNFNGIFSFVPCSKDGAFARPIIKLDNVINPLQKQGVKISSNQDVVDKWGQITQQIFNQGLCLMINNELPKKR